MMPPTTPPAIAPVFELPLKADGTGEEDVLDVVVVPPPTRLGLTEALPVTSGESVAELRMHIRCGSLSKIRTAGKLRLCCIPVTGLRGKCEGIWYGERAVRGSYCRYVEIRPIRHPYPHWNGFREAGGSVKLRSR
jgi:hypothetical protein